MSREHDVVERSKDSIAADLVALSKLEAKGLSFFESEVRKNDVAAGAREQGAIYENIRRHYSLTEHEMDGITRFSSQVVSFAERNAISTDDLSSALIEQEVVSLANPEFMRDFIELSAELDSNVYSIARRYSRGGKRLGKYVKDVGSQFVEVADLHPRSIDFEDADDYSPRLERRLPFALIEFDYEDLGKGGTEILTFSRARLEELRVLLDTLLKDFDLLNSIGDSSKRGQ